MKVATEDQIKIMNRIEELGAQNDEQHTTRSEKGNEIYNSSAFHRETKLEDQVSKSNGVAVGTDDDLGGFKDGNFNEKESHQSFLEALNEWRQGKSQSTVSTQSSGIIKNASTDRPDSKSKTVRFNEEETKKQTEKPPIGVKNITTKKLTKKISATNSTGTIAKTKLTSEGVTSGNGSQSQMESRNSKEMSSKGKNSRQSEAATDMTLE